MKATEIEKFLDNCKVDANEKITSSDDSWWSLKDLIAHAIEVHSDSLFSTKEKEEKEFEIDFAGHILAGVRIKDNTPEVFGAMDGYGHGIRMADIKITEKPSKD